MIQALTKYEGLAVTEYILDASIVSPETLSKFSKNSQSGTTSKSPLTSAGGKITLNTTSTSDTAAIELPDTPGNSSSSILGLYLEVIGLTCASNRGNLDVGFLSPTKDGWTKILWDRYGIRLTTTNASPTDEWVAKVSSSETYNSTVGLFVEIPGGTSTARATGWFGGTEVSNGPGVFASGLLTPTVAIRGTTDPASVSIQRMTMGVVWNIPGSTIQKIYQ